MKLNSAKIQVDLTDALERHRVAGASIAIMHEGALAMATAGYANISTGVGLTTDTMMHIGSITKVLNATLVMQLVDEGLLDLEVPVSQYLPDFRVKDPSATEEITVKMLINHTSGIDGDTTIDHGHDEETVEKAVARMSTYSQIFPPGADCSYSNAATVVAGHLAARVTGVGWYELIKNRVFKPLNMRCSIVLPEDALLARASMGHFLDWQTNHHIRSSHAFLPLGFAPAGHTAMMSPSDLVIFAQMHLSNGLGPDGSRMLSVESARLMRETTTPGIGRMPYGVGLGWMTYGNGVVGHGGGGPGVVGRLYASPRHQFAIAILTNSDNGDSLIEDFAAPYLQEVCGFEIPHSSASDVLPNATIDNANYVGCFEDSWMSYTIAEKADGLVLSTRTKIAIYDVISTEPTDSAVMLPVGDDQFVVKPTDQQRNANREAFPQAGDVLITLRNKDSLGRPQHLASGSRLYRRAGEQL